MIVKFLCEPFIVLAEFLVKLLPSFPRFEGLTVSFDSLSYVIKLLNTFISFSTLSKCMLILLVVYNLKFGWSILMWVIRKIPGVS